MYLASVILLCYIDTKTAMQRDWVCTGFCQYYPKNGSFWIFTRKQRDWLIKSRWRGNNKKGGAKSVSLGVEIHGMMQLPSFNMRTPCTGHSVRGDFFLLFLLACLCELHRIRIVQAEMGLAGSRTPFSFPPNRKPSFLSAIFCICHHVCPLVHPNLPVTAFGWQFLYRGCVFVVTVFLLSNFSGVVALRTTAFTSERWAAGNGGLHPAIICPERK